MNFWTQSKDNIYVAAHRGFRTRYPENTMPAFKAAMELGVDQVETDIRITKDGELVLIHDAKVDRTTDGEGLVIDYTYDELQKLDAGSWKGEEFVGYRIPTLREFMELASQYPAMTVDLELKEYPTPGHEEIAYSVCDRVLAMVEEFNFADRIVINTFHPTLHEYIQKKYGNRYRQHVYFPLEHHTKQAQLTMDPYSYGYCCCMFGKPIMASAEDFAAMKEKGVQPWAGAAVKDAEGVDEAIRCGAELITCDNPDVILQLLRQRGKHK